MGLESIRSREVKRALQVLDSTEIIVFTRFEDEGAPEADFTVKIKCKNCTMTNDADRKICKVCTESLSGSTVTFEDLSA